MQINRITDFLHYLLSPFIRTGDLVVDATVGNGHDAVFLAEAAGENGHLFGFDIQEKAVGNTRARLAAAGIDPSRFTLFLGSHRDIADRVPEGIGAAVYNLGYLPGGEKGIVTDGATVVASVGDCLELLRPEGVLSVTIYHGHRGSAEESSTVLEHLRSLDPRRWKALELSYPNFPNDPPGIVVVQRAG